MYTVDELNDRLIDLAFSEDIGDGTSDVAITKNGSVIAYGMVPKAGDEITEAISQNFLLDFNVAEAAKRAAAHGEKVAFSDILGCAAAKGEFESISFSVCPSRDLKKVDFVPSDLTGPGGAKIPASASDFALVKCWYRAQGRWETSWSGHTGKPTLINDLILHDNDLVRVVEAEDYADRTILLRFSYADGPVWVDMKKHGAGKDHFRHEIFPVKDAKKFVPFDLKKGRYQQYWFTWKVPEDAKPGLYRGTLAVKEDGKDIDSIKVELEVYPFALPTPRTHYDASKRFTVSWMGTPSIAGELKYCKDLKIAEQKVFNIYKSLADHNADEPSGPGAFGECSSYAISSS